MALPKSRDEREHLKFREAPLGPAVAIVNDDQTYLYLNEQVNSQLTFEGWAIDLGAGTDDPKWRIARTVRTGNLITKQFATLSGESTPSADFVHIWDDRADLFDAVAFDSPASLLFDGTDEHVTLGDNYTFGPATAFSWSFWMKAQNTAAQRAMVAKTSQDANVYGYSFQHNSSGNLFAQVRAPSTLRQHTYSSALTAGVWYHIVFTYAGGSNIDGLLAYINASVEPAPSSASLAAWTVTDPLMFARRGTTFHFSGNLNQVSVWNKALSQSEVTELYNSGAPSDLQSHSAAANLLSWWKLADSSNFPTEVDQEGSVNGTLVNMELSDYDEGDVP